MAYAQPFFLEGKITEVLPGFDDNTFDACLCDPPYLLEFMGKEFDRQHKGMAGENDGQRMYAWHLEWAREVYRVLKPGAFIMAFGGTRTVHRLTCALEDVGFEIRDTIEWMYGSGFPKSLDISKAIDKANGETRKTGPVDPSRAGRLVNQSSDYTTDQGSSAAGNRKVTIDPPASEESARWSGYGTALKPAHEPIVLAMKPTVGTFAQNALEYGVAGLNVDGSRVSTKDRIVATRNIALGSSSGGVYSAANVPGVYEQKEGGRWPSDLILSHHPSCRETGTSRVRGSRIDKPSPGQRNAFAGGGLGGDRGPRGIGDEDGMETVPTYDCHPLCPVRMLDEQAGNVESTSGYVGKRATSDAGGVSWKKGDPDRGGPSRFFYTAKVSTRERNHGGTSCNHPTLKPLSLCRYLATLLLPPPHPASATISSTISPRRILIPFSGAGSEAIGASLAGWDEITGIEMSTEYVEQAWARSSAALQD